MSHINIEQRLEVLLRKLRCKWKMDVNLIEPFHVCRIIVTRNDIVTIKGVGKSLKKKVAIQNAMISIWNDVLKISDPCNKEILWKNVWEKISKPICIFMMPPYNWFNEPQTLGIDWEGCPPSIVQIACKSGVYIDNCNALYVKEILNNEKHTHCVFGEHETHLVKNPLNLQLNNKVSLAELTSITFNPKIRFIKDKAIHKRINWEDRPISREGILYAATDAEITRRLGITYIKKNNNS